MTPQDLIDACQEQINIFGDNAEKMLIMRGRWGKRNYRTLLGVRGEIVLEREKDILVMFPAKELKAAVERELAKEVEGGDGDA